MHRELASPADWISPDNRTPNIKTDPLAWDGKKVSILDTDHIWGHGGTSAWVWKSFLRGHNPILMDSWEPIPGTPCGSVNWASQPGHPTRDLNRRDDPTWEPVRRAMGHARSYSLRMNLTAAAPHGELASSGYCLANPGKEYLVYLPEGDEVRLDLTPVQGELESEWMHPVEGTITPGGKVKGGANRRFTVPFLGPAVLYCKTIE
ncbi:MAG: putative collagen-binding domain-containing protein [Acidobacteriota bacterium]